MKPNLSDPEDDLMLNYTDGPEITGSRLVS